MPKTGNQLLQAMSQFINDYVSSYTTSDGNSTFTTLVDTSLSRFGDNKLLGQFIRLKARPYDVRRISGNTQSSGTVTVTPAFSAQITAGTAFEVHRYDPRQKFLALDKARLDCVDHIFKIVVDDTITSDGQSNTYDIPSGMEQGPLAAYVESPITVDASWNFLTSPAGDSATGWTATSVTRTTVSHQEYDSIIPKYGGDAAQLVIAASTNGTHSQVVASMTNSITATLAAGRKMTYAKWYYCTTPDRIRLEIVDDAGTDTSGKYHQGKGWELLYCERTIAGNNTTTLTVRDNVTSDRDPLTIFWNRGWFYFGDKERVIDALYRDERTVNVRRDDTNKHLILATIPPRGYQVRLVGRAPLSALGDGIQFADKMLSLAPTGYWRMGEASGNNLDSSANNNPGVVTLGSGARDALALDQGGDGSVDFDGAAAAGTVVTVTDAATIQNIFDTGGTLFCMFNADDFGVDGARIVAKGLNGEWTLSIGNTGALRFGKLFAGSTTTDCQTTRLLTAGRTYAACITYNADSDTNLPTFYLYDTLRDTRETLVVGRGLSQNSAGSGLRVTDVADDLWFGNTSAQTLTFDGKIDEIAIWKGNELTAEEVSDLFDHIKLGQGSNTMEVDDQTQEVLAAYAAKQLFEWEGIKADDIPAVSQRINNVLGRIPGLQRAWHHSTPEPSLRSPWAL